MTFESINLIKSGQVEGSVEASEPEDSIEHIAKDMNMRLLHSEVGEAEDSIKSGLGGSLEANGTRTQPIYPFYSQTPDE